MKKIAEGAITDRPKMKQRRRSNHGPSKIEEKVSKEICTGTSHGPSKNGQHVQKRSKMVKIDGFGSGEWPAASSAKNQYKVAPKRTCV